MKFKEIPIELINPGNQWSPNAKSALTIQQLLLKEGYTKAEISKLQKEKKIFVTTKTTSFKPRKGSQLYILEDKNES